MAEIPDLSGLFPSPGGGSSDALRAAQIRAQSRVTKGHPLTVQERFAAFAQIGYHPHGLYRPQEPALADQLARTLHDIGAIPQQDQRISKYLALQAHGAQLEQQGVPGRWDGMQAVARSTAKYRVVAQSRRVGKTYHATREAMAVALQRPRSLIWCCGPNWEAVSRVFDDLVRLVRDLGLATERLRDQKDEKELWLADTGSMFIGVSLHELPSIAGASVTFAILDEAAFSDKVTWDRGVQPPLADQDGQALLLSNYFGEDNWFTALAETAERDQDHRIWQLFPGESWTNFYAFPQGRATPSLQVIEASTDPLDFLEQYGGVPISHARRIYREYRDRVHAVPRTWSPHHPVVLAVDPNSGAGIYAVAALQDFGDHDCVVDEYYQDGVITDDVIPVIQARPWADQVTDVILDSAMPDEAERWRRAGFTNAYGVLDKPDPRDRFPIIKRLLRDPAAFRQLYLDRATRLLRAKGDPRQPEHLKDQDEVRLAFEVEESFADPYLTDEDVAALRACARLLVAEHCTWTRYEFKRYAFLAPRPGLTTPERPRKTADHLMDAIGYWGWDRKRFEVDTRPRQAQPYGGGDAARPPDFQVLPGLPEMDYDLTGKPIDADTRARLWLARVRQETAPVGRQAHRYVTRK